MVKYLHDDALQELTAALTEVAIGGRLLNARLEAYSMKRAGTDKKYASQLQLRHTDLLESWQEQLAALASATTNATATTTATAADEEDEPPWKRRRSVSTGDEAPVGGAGGGKLFHSAPDAASAKLLSGGGTSGNKKSTTRPRSNSLDAALPSAKQSKRRSAAETALLAPFHQQQQQFLNRRLLTDLILTLNQAFPDYDFAASTVNDFHLLPSLDAAVARINERLSEVAATVVVNNQQNNERGSSSTNNNYYAQPPHQQSNLLPQLWAAVDNMIQLQPPREQQQQQQVQIYEYVASDDCSFPQRDPDGDDVLWSFHYLFVNKQLKRILLFTCTETIDNNRNRGRGVGVNNTGGDSLLPVVDDDYEDYDVIDDDVRRQRKFSRRESDTSARSLTSRAAEGESEGVAPTTPMETIDDDDDDGAYGDDNDDSSSSSHSVDFDLDPADAVSGGIPVDRV